MTNISFSPEAVSDLQQIKNYITNEFCNEQIAISTIAKITDRIRELATFPEMGAPLSSIIDFNTNYRFLVCNNYTAFYLFENQTVYIVRVLYGRRDFVRILFEEPNGIE